MTRSLTADAARAAFEAEYFGDLPPDVAARERGAHGMYKYADPQYAWTIWQRAWTAALANAAQPAAAPHLLADEHKGAKVN